METARVVDERTTRVERLRVKQARANRACQESLLAYCKHPDVFGDEAPARHHQYLIQKLEQVERGEIKRLMVFMPPGSAKSTYTSVRFASWYLGKHPEHSLIKACHTASLAKRFGRRVRNLVASSDFREIFPAVELAGDSQDKGDWATNHGGEYYAVGMDGAIPGRRADGLLIDDPIKGRKRTARRSATRPGRLTRLT
jgi:hypothetical protein